jgi:hypothetical protein
VRGDGRCQRTREAAAQLRAPVRLDRGDQPLGLGPDELRESLLHRVEAERPRERGAMAPVFGAVEREHARTDDLPGGETGIVDREGRWVAHRLQGEIAPGDEPAPERGEPGNRLALTQPREKRMRIELELLEAGGGANRERALPLASSGFTHTPKCCQFPRAELSQSWPPLVPRGG